MIHKLSGRWRYKLIRHVLEFTLFAMYKGTEIYYYGWLALQTSISLQVHQMCTAEMHIYMGELVQGGNMIRTSRILDTTSLYE